MVSIPLVKLSGVRKADFLEDRSEMARQVVAYLVNKDRDNMWLLRMIKLIYAAEKKHLKSTGNFILSDKLQSWQHGPVCSHTYNMIEDSTEDKGHLIWYVKEETSNGKRRIYTKWDGKDTDELDMLSPNIIKSLDDAWEELKDKNHNELKKYAHDPKVNPEWKKPENQERTAINLKALLKGIGITNKDEIEQIKENLSLDYELQ